MSNLLVLNYVLLPHAPGVRVSGPFFMPHRTDRELVDLARAGDAEAFGAIVRRHQKRIFRLTSHLLRSAAEAEDITQETFVRAYLKDSAELQEFVGKNSLRRTQLDGANPETSGWVLFSTKSKWIGGWKKQEEMILRVPLNGKIYEFPFTLPPKAGRVMLRKR